MAGNKLRKAKKEKQSPFASEKCSYLNPIITATTGNIASELKRGTSLVGPAHSAEQKYF